MISFRGGHKMASENFTKVVEAFRRVAADHTIISGFISPIEREVYRALSEIEGAQLVKVLPCAMYHDYQPGVEWLPAIKARRLAIIARGNSPGDMFRTKGKEAANTLTLNITGGTFTSRADPSAGYDMFYFLKGNYTINMNITGGEFNSGTDLLYFDNGPKLAESLTDACKAKFKFASKESFKAGDTLLADGYEYVLGNDDYYTIAKIPSFTVTFSQNNAPIVGADKTILRDTVLNADHLPEVSGGTWDVDPIGAVITSNTNFNYTVAVGPDWPSDDPDFPADADAEVKAKFADWAKQYDVKDPTGKSDNFLMNVAPDATVPTLTIESIEVADGIATIKVSAGEKNLKEINGVLFVSATDDLAGEWVTTEVEQPADYEDEGLTAVFEVEGAQFMKAKVGFKVETPVDKE